MFKYTYKFMYFIIHLQFIIIYLHNRYILKVLYIIIIIIIIIGTFLRSWAAWYQYLLSPPQYVHVVVEAQDIGR
jgi:ABC-type enterochelin transport system permease subunit